MSLGVLGVILPLVPATPFLLLASFCFMKGSKKFELWFKGTKIYKNYLEDFVKERALTARQKLTILLFADCMIAIPFFLFENMLIKIGLAIIVGYKYYYFIYKINTKK